MTLELYYYQQCPFCRIVIHKIDELSLTDRVIYKNTLEDIDHRTYHINLTGRATVPCLYINGSPLFESRDICNWLDENSTSITEQDKG